MDDVFRIFGLLTGVGLAGAAIYAAVAFTTVFVRRLERKVGPEPERLEAELADLRSRLDESDDVRGRVAELEERLDFAERMLAQRSDPARLPAGTDAP